MSRYEALDIDDVIEALEGHDPDEALAKLRGKMCTEQGEKLVAAVLLYGGFGPCPPTTELG